MAGQFKSNRHSLSQYHNIVYNFEIIFNPAAWKNKTRVMTSLQTIKRQIEKDGRGFIALSKIPALKVHVQFTGRLQNEELLWDATIQTLADYHNEHFPHPNDREERAKYVNSFIEVQTPQNHVAPLTVVLPVPMIDEPAIKKTIVMIRCYKRLRVGRHDFGSTH
jgi:hypothetical protein